MNLFQNMLSAFPVYQQQQTAQQQAMLKLQQEQQAIAYQKMQMDELQRQQAAAAQWQEQLRASQAQQMGLAQQTPSPGQASQPMQQAQPYQAMPTQPAYPQQAQQVQIPPPPRAQAAQQTAQPAEPQRPQPAEPQRPQPVPDYNTARAGFMQKTYPAYQQAVLSQDPTAQKYAQNAEKDFEHYYASLEKQYGQQETTYRDFQKEQAEARKEKAPKGSDHELLVAAGFVPGTPAYQAEAKKLLAKRDRIPGGAQNPAMSAAPATTEDAYKVAARFGMTPQAFEKAVDRFNKDGTLPPTSRSQKNMPLLMAIQDRAAEKNPDADVSTNKAVFKADEFAYKQTENREAAVERTLGAVDKNFPRIQELVKKLNSSLPGEYLNAKMNDAIGKFGDNAELAELANLVNAASREYAIAVKMPGSNAQMHISHSEEADRMLNMNMPINKLMGAITGIKQDMRASRDALRDEKQRLLAGMRELGRPAESTAQKAHPQDEEAVKWAKDPKNAGNPLAKKILELNK